MGSFFKRLFGKSEPKENNEANKASENEPHKRPRPKFTKEETFALGSAALSYIIVNGKPDTKAEAALISELEGFTVADVRQLYQNLQKDQLRLALELKRSLALSLIHI